MPRREGTIFNQRLVNETAELVAKEVARHAAAHLDPEALREFYGECYRVARAGIETALLAHERLAHQLRPVNRGGAEFSPQQKGRAEKR